MVPTGTLPDTGALNGSIVLSYNGASTSTATIAVTLKLTRPTSAPPFGVVDTPLENTSGVTGAVPFTGWALDDVEVAAVSLCRDAVAGEAGRAGRALRRRGADLRGGRAVHRRARGRMCRRRFRLTRAAAGPAGA